MRKKTVLMLILLCLVSTIYAESSIHYLSKGYADTLYCAIGGDCWFTSLNVTNINVTSQTVNGTINAWDYWINGTSVYDIFCTDCGGGGNPFNQSLNTTDDVEFNSVTVWDQIYYTGSPLYSIFVNRTGDYMSGNLYIYERSLYTSNITYGRCGGFPGCNNIAYHSPDLCEDAECIWYPDNVSIVSNVTKFSGDIEINGKSEAHDYQVNGTSIFGLFGFLNWNNTPINVKTINSTEITSEYLEAVNSTYPPVPNGDFSAGTDWTFGGNWFHQAVENIANHSAIGNNDILEPNPALQIRAGKGYEVTLTHKAGLLMEFCITIGNAPEQCTTGYNEDTTTLEFMSVDTSNLKIRHNQLVPPGFFRDGWVDNIIVKEIGDSDAVAKYVNTKSAIIEGISDLNTIKADNTLLMDTSDNDVLIDSSNARTLSGGTSSRSLGTWYIDELDISTGLTLNELSVNNIIDKDNGYVYVKSELRVRDSFKLPFDSDGYFSCDSSHGGYIFYNSTDNTFRGCNETDWVMLG